MRNKYNNYKKGRNMKKIYFRNFKAVNITLIFSIVTLLCLVLITPALSNTYVSTSDGDSGALLMKVVVGHANKCDGDPASGGSVSVSSSLGTRSSSVLGDGSFQVDISGTGPSDPDWPAGQPRGH